MSGLNGGYEKSCHPSFRSFWRVLKEMDVLVLSRWNTIRFLFASLGWSWSITWFNRSSRLQRMVHWSLRSYGSTLWFIVSFQSHRTPCKTFLAINNGLEKCLEQSKDLLPRKVLLDIVISDVSVTGYHLLYTWAVLVPFHWHITSPDLAQKIVFASNHSAPKLQPCTCIHLYTDGLKSLWA